MKMSLWGALIALKSAVNQGQTLSVVNQAPRETKGSHVVYVGPMLLGNGERYSRAMKLLGGKATGKKKRFVSEAARAKMVAAAKAC
jgi:hypothetical protein